MDTGFKFGAMSVEATAMLPEGRSVITIRTDAGRELTVYCSATGRSLRVFENNSRELK